jgi:hypothetical protein
MNKFVFSVLIFIVLMLVACTKLDSENLSDRIKGEGEMCGGIAGFQCEEGLTCRMEGNYPDAAGTCVKSEKPTTCPQLMPPGPDFCPNGTIKPNYDESRCIRGYSCEKSAGKTSLDDSCNVHSDCQVKNIGNCCGYYPACLNKDAITNPEAVKEECSKKGLASVCGFPDIKSCSCAGNKCVAN